MEGRGETTGIGRLNVGEGRGQSMHEHKKSETREASERDTPRHAATSYCAVRPRWSRFRPNFARAPIRAHGTFVAGDISVHRYVLGWRRSRKTHYPGARSKKSDSQ